MPPEAEPTPIPTPQELPGPRRTYALGCIILLALALFLWKASIATRQPFFTGDAGHRMNNAHRVLARLGNRVWLPYLQAHVWTFYRLRLPYESYQVIPCFYFFLAVLMLGLLGYRIIGRTYLGLLFTLAVMLCFAQQQQVASLSVRLYQEITGIALFYALLYAGALELPKRPLLLLIAGAALLARDTFWIYLLSLTLLNRKAILSGRSYRVSFLILWAIPVLWLLAAPLGYLVHEGRLPAFPLEWPVGINREGGPAVTHISTTLRSLWAAVSSSRVVYLLAAVALAWVVNGLHGRRGARAPGAQAEEFVSRFKGFSLLSLTIVYGLIVAFDPWQSTFGNPRMAVPLLEHVFIWMLIAIAATFSYRGAFRYLATAILLAGLLLGVDTQIGAWVPQRSPLSESIYPEIGRLARESSPGAKPVVCFGGGEDYFATLRRFLAPTLYAQRRFLPRDTGTVPQECSLLISFSASRPPDPGNFVPVREYRIEEQSYLIYQRRRPQ